jgi:hypothetical protein
VPVRPPHDVEHAEQILQGDVLVPLLG